MLLLAGDCREKLAEMRENCVDACVTDPPYELNFMGKAWDRSGIAFDVKAWEAVLRVLKPGAHMLCFGGPRTFHRMTVAIEDAGFEIRDCLSWVYSSGMPKGKNLKPAWEPIILARKPISESTIRHNIAKYGTGSLNIEEGRIPTTDTYVINTFDDGAKPFGNGAGHAYTTNAQPAGGRWPANVLMGEDAPDAIARYFFVSKASKREKNLGLNVPNSHPAVKPLTLMKYLVQLITPSGGLLLDPFMGSGSTGCVTAALGMEFVGIDLDPNNIPLAEARITYWTEHAEDIAPPR